MGVNLASFPNSRIQPTPATSLADQAELSGPPAPGVLIIPANANRTYLTIYNRSGTDSFKFLNYSGVGPAPTAANILADGFEIIAGAAYEVDTPEATYIVSTTAAPVPIDTDEGSG